MKFNNYYNYILLLICCISCHKENTNKLLINQVPAESYPLITIGPELNIWSAGSVLYTNPVKQGVRQDFPLTGFLRVDGKVYRFLGSGELPEEVIVPMASDLSWTGRYIFLSPSENWQATDFDDQKWFTGNAPFGSKHYRDISTIWPSENIWVRRKAKIDPSLIKDRKLYVKCSYDDMLELYINGQPVIKTDYDWKLNQFIEIPQEVIATFNKDGDIVFAAHGRNLEIGAFLDFGIYMKESIHKNERLDRYTLVRPETDWLNEDFDDNEWEIGEMPFGTALDYKVNTEWNTRDIWIRSEIFLEPDLLKKDLILNYSHDDIFELYVNGVQLVKTGFEWNMDKTVAIPDSIKQTMQNGKLLIAAHCINQEGGSLVDYQIYGDYIAVQKSVEMQATQTRYLFECGEVELSLNFISPQFLKEKEFSPVNYITYEINSLDNKEHIIDICFEVRADLNSFSRNADTKMYEEGNYLFLRTGRKDQKPFEKINEEIQKGGYFYLAGERGNTYALVGDVSVLRHELESKDFFTSEIKDHAVPYMALIQSQGKIKKGMGRILIGYDEPYAVHHFGENYPAFWKSKGNRRFETVLINADKEFDKITKRCDELDAKLISQSALSPFLYRKFFSSCKPVQGPEGELLIFSNGNVVETTSFASLFVQHDTDMIKGLLDPIFYYCESNKWEKDYPPREIGRYPIFNGQVEVVDQPLFSASHILSLVAAITAAENNPEYARKHWPLLTRWNNYLSRNYGENRNQFISNRLFEDSTSPEQMLVFKGISAYNYMAEMIGEGMR